MDREFRRIPALSRRTPFSMSSMSQRTDRISPTTMVRQFGGRYADQLGIYLSEGKPNQVYQWFIAALLFGARISETIAIHTYRELAHAGMLSPNHMVDACWDRLVQILDHGGYVRYDFKTATKLLDVNRALIQEYRGDLNRLHESAVDAADLERRLKALGKGIGDVTVSIFLRELRGIWPKADPSPSERVVLAAKALGFIPTRIKDPARILQALQTAWRMDGGAADDFPEFEAALVRYEAAMRHHRPQAAMGQSNNLPPAVAAARRLS